MAGLKPLPRFLLGFGFGAHKLPLATASAAESSVVNNPFQVSRIFLKVGETASPGPRYPEMIRAVHAEYASTML